jgi:hypothetical protein
MTVGFQYFTRIKRFFEVSLSSNTGVYSCSFVGLGRASEWTRWKNAQCGCGVYEDHNQHRNRMIRNIFYHSCGRGDQECANVLRELCRKLALIPQRTQLSDLVRLHNLLYGVQPALYPRFVFSKYSLHRSSCIQGYTGILLQQYAPRKTEKTWNGIK